MQNPSFRLIRIISNIVKSINNISSADRVIIFSHLNKYASDMKIQSNYISDYFEDINDRLKNIETNVKILSIISDNIEKKKLKTK